MSLKMKRCERCYREFPISSRRGRPPVHCASCRTVSITCGFCQRSFRGDSERMYCSRECASAARRAPEKPTPPRKPCAECRAPFYPKANQRFCSADCRKVAESRVPRAPRSTVPAEKPCRECGTPFTPRGNQRYCSPECRRKNPPRGIILCLQCGAPFRPQGNQRYCSPECKEKRLRAEYRRAQKRARR